MAPGCSREHSRCLDDLAAAVLERETLTREDLDEIFDAHELTRALLPSGEPMPLIPSLAKEGRKPED